MKRKHPKIIRAANGKGATYDLSDFAIDTNKRALNCPTCGNIILKGEGFKSSYVHAENGFIIRHRIHCSKECTPNEIISK